MNIVQIWNYAKQTLCLQRIIIDTMENVLLPDDVINLLK